MWTFITSDDPSIEWFKETSPNNDHIILAKEVSNSFLNGPTKISVRVYNIDNDEKILISSFTKSLKNKGKPLDETNYSIDWNKEYALLTLYNEDETYSKFRFYWEDFND